MIATSAPESSRGLTKAPRRTLVLILLTVLITAPTARLRAETPAADPRFEIEPLLEGLVGPVTLTPLPDGRVLLAERAPGRLSIVLPKRRLSVPVSGLPPIYGKNDAGLLDVVLDPAFAENSLLFLSYSEGDDAGSTVAVDVAELVGDRLEDRRRLLTADARSSEAFHYGGRLRRVADELYITIGDRHRDANGQELTTHAGKILRIRADGSVPVNPFFGRDDARPEIWSYGHRNPQGLLWDGERLLSHEHGPLGGDELNVIVAGGNFGWPNVSWGFAYEGATTGDRVPVRSGVVAPIRVWSPGIAPSALVRYDSDAIPGWRGSILIGGMASRSLHRLQLRGDVVVSEERLLIGRGLRVRSVAVLADGSVLVGSDSGSLLRLLPTGR